jgi:hypothetical protein
LTREENRTNLLKPGRHTLPPRPRARRICPPRGFSSAPPSSRPLRKPALQRGCRGREISSFPPSSTTRPTSRNPSLPPRRFYLLTLHQRRRSMYFLTAVVPNGSLNTCLHDFRFFSVYRSSRVGVLDGC